MPLPTSWCHLDAKDDAESPRRISAAPVSDLLSHEGPKVGAMEERGGAEKKLFAAYIAYFTRPRIGDIHALVEPNA